jgi:purine-binding chemotaxis protein CheW
MHDFKKNEEPNQKKIERYLEFNLGEEAYAIPLLSVKEVITIPETTRIPNSPAYYIGIMNLRGQIISIIDLRKKLGIKSQDDSEEAVVIVEVDNLGIGLVVDSINKVLNIPMDQLKEVPEVSSQVNAKYIEGVYSSANKLIMTLYLNKILNISEINQQSKKVA